MAIYEIGSDCFDIMYRKLTTTSYQQRRTLKNLQVDIFKGQWIETNSKIVAMFLPVACFRVHTIFGLKIIEAQE